MKPGEILFYITHPFPAVKAKLRQVEVFAEWGGPPAGTTIEDFPNLSIQGAAALIAVARRDEGGGGVQLQDWSPEDQARMARGELPHGTPNHRNL